VPAHGACMPPDPGSAPGEVNGKVPLTTTRALVHRRLSLSPPIIHPRGTWTRLSATEKPQVRGGSAGATACRRLPPSSRASVTAIVRPNFLPTPRAV
jgi:hypothetical protein